MSDYNQCPAVPVFVEYPNSIASSLEMMKDLEGKTAIPVQIFLDWGHMLCKPFTKDECDMEMWALGYKGGLQSTGTWLWDDSGQRKYCLGA